MIPLSQEMPEIHPHQPLFWIFGQFGGNGIGKLNLILLIKDDDAIVPHLGNLLEAPGHLPKMLLRTLLFIFQEFLFQFNHSLFQSLEIDVLVHHGHLTP